MKFDLNNTLFLFLAIISLFMIKNKISYISGIALVLLILIGYSITNNLFYSVAISVIFINILLASNSKLLSNLDYNKYSLKNNENSNIKLYCTLQSKNNNIENKNINRSVLPLRKENVSNIEGFANKNDKSGNNDSIENFSKSSDDIMENHSNSSSDKKSNQSSNKSEEEYVIDSKGSFLDNYKSLSNKQIKGLNKDTVSLINTQKQLIETLKNMGPALKDGKEVLDTFKNYFGSEKDISKMMSNFKV